ncbi:MULTISPECIES: MerR family transcriptional regulator [Streptomyces]|uniref:MerR family transcriptional regulator n=1 Tax=Streptomyces TaxID=1883 RepID=UPI0004BD776F|nr:MerR family transcriptional regulator [Streptomyces griseolus]
MDYSVGQVAAFAGVSVRTLHHYDKAGLLSPGGRSDSGYRLYGDADLARLQQILFYRELGFPLDEIAAVLDGPRQDATERLRARRRALHEEIARLRHLADVAERAIAIQRTGVPMTAEERSEVFGEITFDLSYATEAQLKWGHSETHGEAMARASGHTKEDWRRLMAEAADWRADLLAAFTAGEPADGERAMDLAEAHRAHLARWFTPCPPEVHRRVADDFAADPRAFALVVPASEQSPGLAVYLRDAVHANAARTGRAPAEKDER